MFIKQVQAQITNPAIPSVYSANPGGGFAILISSIWRALILVGGIALLLMFAMGGIQWLMAGDDKNKVENARNRITHAIIGISILAVSVAVMLIVQEVLQVDILNPVFTGP